MGKVLKKVGTIASFVGLAVGVVATGGLLAAGAPLLTAVSTGFGATIGGLGLSAGSIIAGGAVVSALAGSIMKGPQLEDIGANTRSGSYVDPNALGAFVFGETAFPSVLVFEQVHGADSDVISSVSVHAWHEVESYVSITVEGETVSFSGEAATGDFAGILTWKRREGAAGQTTISLPSTEWSSAPGAGMAHSAMIWNFKDQTKFPQGVPQNFTIRGRGALLYDPRLDSTAGGAGSHRYDDPSTWTWNDGNAALVLLRYIIGEYKSGESAAAGDRPIWGIGDELGDVVIESFIAAANVCDELRDGVPRYRLGGAFATSNDHARFIQQWEASTGGKVARSGGRRYVWVPHDDLTPVATITQNECLEGAPITMDLAFDVRDLYNTARGRYISAADQYQGAPYPEVQEAAALARDGRERILPVDFGWVQDVSTAERLARYAVRRSRFGKMWRLAVDWRGLDWPPFTVLNLNLDETMGVDQIVRVIENTISLDGVCQLTLQEEDASIYDDTIPLGTPPVNNTIPDRLDRLGGLTPRYTDGTPIDDLVASAMNKRFADDVVGSDGGTGRQIAIGPASGYLYDGDAVSFSQSWVSPPVVQFGAGGISKSDALTGDQQQVFRAENLTVTGFTASLKLKSAGGGGTTYTDGPGANVGGTPAWQIDKSQTAQDDNNAYIFRVTVNAEDGGPPGEPVDGWVRVGFYTRTTSGGAWTLRETVTRYTSGTFNNTVNVSGLGTNAAFGVHKEAGLFAFNTVTAFVSVKYTVTGLTEVTATPAGSSPVPYWLIGNKGTI
jgi:hypothetical protein